MANLLRQNFYSPGTGIPGFLYRAYKAPHVKFAFTAESPVIDGVLVQTPGALERAVVQLDANDVPSRELRPSLATCHVSKMIPPFFAAAPCAKPARPILLLHILNTNRMSGTDQRIVPAISPRGPRSIANNNRHAGFCGSHSQNRLGHSISILAA